MSSAELERTAWEISRAAEQPARELTAQQRAENRMRKGNALVIAGFAVTVVGVVAYCLACFAGGMDQDISAILFENVVPFARATLVVLGIGTVLWLAGSFLYLSGAMDLNVDDTRKS